VDDHDLIRKSIAKVLRRLDFIEIIECANGKTAKATIDSRPLDLIICDPELSIISGFELLDHLRTLDTGSDVPFMIVTGAADKDDIVKAADKGAEEYMVKPFTPEELEAKIVKILNQYHSPGPILARIRQIEKFIQIEKFPEAERLMRETLKMKDNARTRHLMSVLLIKEKKITDAVEQLQLNIKNYPNFLKNYVTLSNLYIENKDFSNAIRILGQELDLNPKQPLRQIKLANMLLKENNSIAAIEHYRLALLENNKNPEALYGMGTAYAMADNLEKSSYYFKRYRRNNPKDSRPLKAIIQFSERANQPKVAEIILIDERKMHPERMDTYLLLADFYFKHDQIESAVSTLEAAIKRKPDFPGAHLALAQHYMKQKDTDNAIKVLQTFVQSTHLPEAYMQLAQLFLFLKKYAQALIILHQSLDAKLEPKKVFPLLMLASFRTKQLCKTWFIRERVKQLAPDEVIPEPIAEVDEEILARRQSKAPFKQVS
ncbi:MAG: response regulator, partial [Proteobacteria bacterium]|nr:response regulator [Pseudomonadota bacterium]